jgi:CHAD domain-containing protein
VAKVVREIERKYDGTGIALPSLDSLTGVASASPPQEHVLDAVYFDTEDLRLVRAGVTLRQRSGGDDAGWHLKLPVVGSTDTRDEIRLPPGDPGGPVPDELAALVQAHTRGAALVPVMHMRTVRGSRRLLDETGRPLAEIAVDAVSADPMTGSPPVSWEEIEVELVAGDAVLLDDVDARLRSAGARRATSANKLERALADRLRAIGEQPDTARDRLRQPLTEHSTAGDVVLAYLATQVRAITSFDPRVRRDEPDSVHQMRVATRRARSALQAFRRLFDWERVRPICDELKWLAAVLGRARDAEVLLARFTDELAAIPAGLVAGPIRARITRHFTKELKLAREAALRELDGKRYFALLDELDALLTSPPLTPLAARQAGKVLPGSLKKASRRLERALALARGEDGEQASAEDAEGRDAAIHEARKAAKRVRYAAEAAVPALGGSAKGLARDTKKLQELLGEHHDNVVARAILLGIAREAHAAREDTFTYGVLYERHVWQASEIERSLREPGHALIRL